jgi:hypothetical protein
MAAGQGQPETTAVEPHLTAALGTLWAHAVNTRLVLEIVGGSRYLKVDMVA